MDKLKGKRLLAILILAKADEPMFGPDIVAKSEGELKRGTVYVWLSALEREGLVASREERSARNAPQIPRRVYWITESGRRLLKAQVSAVAATIDLSEA